MSSRGIHVVAAVVTMLVLGGCSFTTTTTPVRTPSATLGHAAAPVPKPPPSFDQPSPQGGTDAEPVDAPGLGGGFPWHDRGVQPGAGGVATVDDEGRLVSYAVVEGDLLIEIAHRFGLPTSDFAQGVISVEYPNDPPPPQRHLRAGETLTRSEPTPAGARHDT